MKRTWRNFEDRIRSVASYIWSAEAKPERIAGVSIDCYIRAADDHVVLIEITEERDVQKVRGDVIKLITARNELNNNEKVMCRCFCVVDAETVTQGMVDAGKAERISVVTSRQFERLFFLQMITQSLALNFNLAVQSIQRLARKMTHSTSRSNTLVRMENNIR